MFWRGLSSLEDTLREGTMVPGLSIVSCSKNGLNVDPIVTDALAGRRRSGTRWLSYREEPVSTNRLELLSPCIE
jgi:hypothetical protein